MPSSNIELFATMDYRQIKQDFLEELIISSQGYPSSISYIRHLLPDKPVVTKGIVQAIVIGGTNFEVASFDIENNGTKKELRRRRGMIPQLDSAETFLSFIADHFDSEAVGIALNFGFPLRPDIGKFGEIDSAILYGVKEHAFHGLVNLSIGKFLRENLKIDIPISVANDTVCLALAGNGHEDGGFVLGSGCNMAIITQHADRKMIANLEAGNFSKFNPTPGLEAIDEVSPTRGKNRFEKLISGIYIPMHFNFMAKQFNISAPTVANGKEVTAIAAHDGTIVGDLARGVLERSASLAATVFAAVYEFRNSPASMEFLVEGSVFLDGWDFHKNFQKRLTLMGVPEGTVKMKTVVDSSLNGAIGLLTK
jgi:hexokinase